MTFEGYTRESLRFFNNLQRNNNKIWFESNRDVYEREILLPAKAFVKDMGNKLSTIVPNIVADPRTDRSIFRIHRDIRFSKEKLPYKTHLGIYWWEGRRKKLENPGFYFQFDSDSLFLGAGMHIFPKDILKYYREAVVNSITGSKLISAVNQVQDKDKEYKLGWKHYKTIPKKYVNSPNAEYLLFNGIGFHVKSSIPEEFYSPELINYCFKIFKDMSPIHLWLKEILD